MGGVQQARGCVQLPLRHIQPGALGVGGAAQRVRLPLRPVSGGPRQPEVARLLKGPRIGALGSLLRRKGARLGTLPQHSFTRQGRIRPHVAVPGVDRD